MSLLERTTGLDAVRLKVEAGERLDLDDGITLLESDDVLGLGELADRARRLRGGTDEVTFVQNLYLNQTNVCRVKCKFCAFAATSKQEHAYTIETDDLVADAVAQHAMSAFTEIHIVNGESPHVGFDFYLDTIRGLKAALPDVHLKCYTASEIHHMTTLSGLTHEEVLRQLKDAGLGSLTGGGAEIFADRVRALVAPGKEHPDIWFHVHDTAHRLGFPSVCSMLYGHVETYEERIDHLLRLRDQQDRTGGFVAFVPLAFHPENTVFERRGFRHTTGVDDLKTLAVSRLMLDNIPNVKAYWIMMGMPLAAVALHFGANDVQGTVMRETIFHAAGARTETEQKIDQLVRFVKDAGRIPVQRDSVHNPILDLRVTEFLSSVPIVPARDVEVTTGWYRDELGYEVFHTEREYGIVGRGESWIHFWGPSSIAPEKSMTVIRVGVVGIDALYARCGERGIVHENAPLEEQPWGFREFSVRDCDGNLVTFFEPPIDEETP